MVKPVRRVVTGLDSNGRARVLIDDVSPHVHSNMSMGETGGGITEIWSTSESPATYDNLGDRAIFPVQHDPNRNGSIFRLIELMPTQNQSEIPLEEMLVAVRSQFEAIQSKFIPTSESVARHPTFHKTDSVDYLVVLSGELTMLLDDDEEVTLHAGDVIVQQGVMHGWRVEGNEPVQLIVVLIDGASAYDE